MLLNQYVFAVQIQYVCIFIKYLLAYNELNFQHTELVSNQYVSTYWIEKVWISMINILIQYLFYFFYLLNWILKYQFNMFDFSNSVRYHAPTFSYVNFRIVLLYVTMWLQIPICYPSLILWGLVCQVTLLH